MTAAQPVIPQLAFDEREVAHYARMRTGVAEFQAVKAEVEAGQRALPELARAAKAAIDSIQGFAPSRLVAYHDDVAAAFQAKERAERVYAAVKSSVARFETRLAVLTSDLQRSFNEAQQALRWKVRDSFPAPARNDAKLLTNSGVVSPACSEAISRVLNIGGETIADRANALLALATEHGLKLKGDEP